MRRKRPLFAANQVLLAAALTLVLVVAGHGPGWLLAGFGLCAGLTAPVLTGGYSSQRTVPPDRYAQASATGASLKTGAYALGAACVGLLTGVLTARELMLAIAAGQLLAALPLLSPSSSVPVVPNEPLVLIPDASSAD